ncbi:MAG: hypothetical protein LBJ00_01075 [Planctomycetaceae bacterium]|nr:hypothetical protein [Planctomycetaceae bacterium]
MKRLFKGEAYRPTGYGIRGVVCVGFVVYCHVWKERYTMFKIPEAEYAIATS